MKIVNSRSVVLNIIAGAFSLAAVVSVFADTFDLSTLKTNSDGFAYISGSAQRQIRLEDPAGVTLVDDAAVTNKALVFSGKQTKPGLLNFRDPAISVSVSVKIKPDEDGAGDQTIFMHPGNFELRYSAGRKSLTLFANYKDKATPITVLGALTPGKWNDVKILIKDQDVKLTVDGTETSAKLPDGATMAGAKSFFRIGATGDGKRPFKGALANLNISEPAE